MSEIKKYVDNIRDEIKAVYDGKAENDDGDTASLYDYFSDALDIEYTISSSGEYLGARVWVTLGGPNVWIDTREGYVKGAWGSDRAEAWIPAEINNEINDMFAEYYACIKG